MIPPIIYFARSIRGAHSGWDANRSIMSAIRNSGCRLAMDLPVTISKTDRTTEEYIYERDLAWLDHSDAVIAEVTNASLGVGYEIACAHHINHIPVLCVAQEGCKLSAMIAGGFKVKRYADQLSLDQTVTEFLTLIKEILL